MSVLKLESKGTLVSDLQSILIDNNYLAIARPTGLFGKLTQTAVLAFQLEKGLTPDGIVGGNTWRELNKLTKKNSKFLTPGLLDSVAISLGIDVKLLKALDKIESSGTGGFLKTGELKILYERHIFNRECANAGLHKLAELVRGAHPELCNTKSGGYIGGAAENAKLAVAKTIHPEIAARSASYGRYQLMGFRYQWCGFSSAIQMESVLNKHEDEHLHALANFIEAQPELLKAMQELDFASIAYIYNGPKHHKYDDKLKGAYSTF